MSLVARKPVFGVSDKARLKPVSSATETSWKNEISLVASLDIELHKTRITKVLIRLRGCAGWSAPVLFANPRRQVFSRQGPNGELRGIWPCYLSFKIANDKGADQTARMRSLVCAFVVRKQQSPGEGV